MKNWRDWIEHVVYYTIIFFILTEWLRPVMELTDTGYFEMFSLFVVLCLALALLRVPLLLSWLAKCLYIFAFIVHVYGGMSVFSGEGAQYLLAELLVNGEFIRTGNFAQVTDSIRTSLFFILIWMLVYLIHHWVAVRMTIFYFFVMTVFFIATLDTFTTYDGSVAIVKVVLLGLVMTALLFFKRLVATTKAMLNWRTYALYTLSVVVLISFAGVLAFLLPKAGPQWADPVPFLQAATGQSSTQTNDSGAKVGYGENDERLGGPFEADDSIVFEISAPTRQYWRIEMRDLYTSKGWESATDGIQRRAQGEELPLSLGVGDGDNHYAIITTYSNYPFLLQPYRTDNYDITGEDLSLSINTGTERVDTLVGGKPSPVSQYAVFYRQPEYSYTALKETLTSSEEDGRYLQLPDNLPQRVRDLALDITANAESVYDKARAVESYFQRSGFRYETQDVPFPEGNQDYVDQFLFETKYGYCDNFSTSMVVLLRAVDIQARWVKGFTGGQEVGWEGDLRKYEVANNNAHSWVEVYIDGEGWLPFEPTVGFSNPVNIDYDIETTEQPEQEQLEPEQPEEQEETVAVTSGNGLLKTGVTVALIVLLMALAAFGLWKLRQRKRATQAVAMVNNNSITNEQVDQLYDELLRKLAKQGMKRLPHQTLQQFAKQVDTQLETDKMTELTRIYERWIYRAEMTEKDALEMRESWEYLINRTTG